LLEERFEVVQELAKGGFGAVYTGIDQQKSFPAN